MTFLLDVNVLVALLDTRHVFHERAHSWFETIGSPFWATCPLTENGLLRIFGHPRYPNGAGSPAQAARDLGSWRSRPGHVFWSDDVSILDERLIDPAQLARSSQLTDTYLLALAVSRGGTLATLDRRLSMAAVRGGAAALHVIG